MTTLMLRLVPMVGAKAYTAPVTNVEDEYGLHIRPKLHLLARATRAQPLAREVQIALKSNFLDASHCLLYGELPSPAQAQTWHAAVMRESHLPLPVVNAIEALPADAHPMSIVMAGVVALGTLHPEQNPALAGQGVYGEKAVQDAQIVRLLGMVPAIAAYAYHRCGILIAQRIPLKRLVRACCHAAASSVCTASFTIREHRRMPHTSWLS